MLHRITYYNSHLLQSVDQNKSTETLHGTSHRAHRYCWWRHRRLVNRLYPRERVQRLGWNPIDQRVSDRVAKYPHTGVGEGTWPSMRSTCTIGLAESAFITTCSASFKQGTLFEDWLHDGHRYIHPFTPPLREGLQTWGQRGSAQRASPHLHGPPARLPVLPLVIARQADHNPRIRLRSKLRLSPRCRRLRTATHAARRRATRGWHHRLDIRETLLLSQVRLKLRYRKRGAPTSRPLHRLLRLQALMLDRALSTPLIDQSHILFNNAALAVQVPHLTEDAPIASSTRPPQSLAVGFGTSR